MASVWPGGLVGGVTGPDLLISPNVLLSGAAWFVDNSNALGVDASGLAGRMPGVPLLTTAQAIANASPGDVVVWGSGHDEIISTQVTFSKARMTFIGAGTGTTKPKFRNGRTSTTLFNVAAAGIRIVNAYFPESPAVGVAARISTNQVDTYLRACSFECGEFDAAIYAVRLEGGADRYRSVGNQFLATGSQPGPAVGITATVNYPEFDSDIYDGSTYGWNDYAINALAACSGVFMNNVRLYRAAAAHFPTGTTYQFYDAASDGFPQTGAQLDFG